MRIQKDLDSKGPARPAETDFWDKLTSLLGQEDAWLGWLWPGPEGAPVLHGSVPSQKKS